MRSNENIATSELTFSIPTTLNSSFEFQLLAFNNQGESQENDFSGKILITINPAISVSVNQTTPSPCFGGNGLRNMQRRINQLNGVFLIKHQDGLTLVFEIPVKTFL